MSCISSASQWYSGPINIYTLVVTSPASWTSSSNYVWQSGPTVCGNGQSGCSTGQAWEGSQGVYAPNVRNLNGGTYTMFYSSSDGSTFWNIAAATASSPTGPWTKYASNPVTRSGYAEEPDVLVMPNGNLVMFSDTLATSLGRGISIYTTNAANGLTEPWSWQQFVSWTDPGTFDSNHIGSQSAVLMPNGDVELCFGGNTGGTDQIGCAILRLRQDAVDAYGQSGALQTSYQEMVPNAAGGYPILVSYRGKGVQWIGDASNEASGELILGDIGTLGANVGIYRGNCATNSPGNCLNLDGYAGLNLNVGNAAFGSKNTALAILTNGQITQNVPGTATTYGMFNSFEPALATSNSAGMIFGAAATTNNSVLASFSNAGGAGSASNKASIGLYGATKALAVDGNGNSFIGGGTNTLYRCTTSGTLPVGALTIATGNCGASTDTGLRLE